MKMRPILFNTEMVTAILGGHKTQTRRIFSPNHIFNDRPNDFKFHGFDDDGWANFEDMVQREPTPWTSIKCPYGQIGDVLYVRETWCYVLREHAHDLLEGRREPSQYVFKTDVHSDWMEYAKEKYGYKWRPSIHMPKAAARLFLEITDIRVERLQDITEADAKAEGIEVVTSYDLETETEVEGTYRDYQNEGIACIWAKDSFRSLWDSINADRSDWDANPWVWAVEFKQISKPQ